jgi:hypothetical protein
LSATAAKTSPSAAPVPASIALDEQHDADCADEHEQRRANVARDPFHERHDDDLCVILGFRAGKDVASRERERVDRGNEISLRLVGGYARLHAADHVETPAAEGCGIERQRQPDIGAFRHRELARHHTHDGRRTAIQLDYTTEDLRIASEHPLPEPVADHANGDVVWPVFAGDEGPAHDRRRPEYSEEILRHRRCVDANGIATPRQRVPGLIERRHAGERAAFFANGYE